MTMISSSIPQMICDAQSRDWQAAPMLHWPAKASGHGATVSIEFSIMRPWQLRGIVLRPQESTCDLSCGTGDLATVTLGGSLER
jgi:hypothetical protein